MGHQGVNDLSRVVLQLHPNIPTRSWTCDLLIVHRSKPRPHLSTGFYFGTVGRKRIGGQDENHGVSRWTRFAWKMTVKIVSACTCKNKHTNNTNDSVYGAVVMSRSLREFTRFIWWMQTERQMAANPQTKPSDLVCESPSRLLPSTSTITIC